MEQVGRSIEDIRIFSSRNFYIDDFEIFFSCVKQVGWSIDANLANWPNLAQTGFSNITLSRNIRIDEKEDLQISSKYIFDISCRWWGLDSVTCVLLNISPSHDLLIDLLPDTESVLQTTKIWYINDLFIDLLLIPCLILHWYFAWYRLLIYYINHPLLLLAWFIKVKESF